MSCPIQKPTCDETDSSHKTADTDELNLRLQSTAQAQSQIQTQLPANQAQLPANQVQPIQAFSTQVQPISNRGQGFSPEQSPLPTDRRSVGDSGVWDSNTSVSKVEPPPSDVSPALKKHVSTRINLTPALNQHAPMNIANDQHAKSRHFGTSLSMNKNDSNSPGLRRQLSLRLERSGRSGDSSSILISPLDRTPSFRNDVSSYPNQNSQFRRDPNRSLDDVNIALNRHPLFNDHAEPSFTRKSSFRNNVSRAVTVTRHSSFKRELNSGVSGPDADSLVKVQSSFPRVRPPVSHVSLLYLVHFSWIFQIF